MPYMLKCKESEVFGPNKYVNSKGNTECAEFVRQATGAPDTKSWKPGLQVKGAPSTAIARGTAIATFHEGAYPTDALGKHAAIYLEHDEKRIQVLDQWNSQGAVKKRPIWFDRPKASRSNNGDAFYVIL